MTRSSAARAPRVSASVASATAKRSRHLGARSSSASAASPSADRTAASPAAACLEVQPTSWKSGGAQQSSRRASSADRRTAALEASFAHRAPSNRTFLKRGVFLKRGKYLECRRSAEPRTRKARTYDGGRRQHTHTRNTLLFKSAGVSCERDRGGARERVPEATERATDAVACPTRIITRSRVVSRLRFFETISRECSNPLAYVSLGAFHRRLSISYARASTPVYDSQKPIRESKNRSLSWRALACRRRLRERAATRRRSRACAATCPPTTQYRFAFRCRLAPTVRFKYPIPTIESSNDEAQVTWLSRTHSIVTQSLDTSLNQSQTPTEL